MTMIHSLCHRPVINLLLILSVLQEGAAQELVIGPPPQLDGQHLDITILVDHHGFIDMTDEADGTITYSGYLIEVLEAIARPDRANFIYTFKTPSGHGSLCRQVPEEPYPRMYHSDYGCGESDVTDVPHTNYTTDMYLGTFYITPERQRLNHFTIPLYPPTAGTLAMVGTATGVRDFHDFLDQQEQGKQGPACVVGNSQYAVFLKKVFPTMKLHEIVPGDPFYDPMNDGTCDVLMVGYPFAAVFVKRLSQGGRCLAGGKPVGIIGDPLGFGPNFFGIGIRKDLPFELVDTLNFWLNTLMTCSPTTECPDDSLAVLYPENGGTGRECNYVQFPSDDGLAPKFVALIVVVAVALVAALAALVLRIRLRAQQRRFRKRFVKHIASNITLGPSPSCTTPVDKLVEEVQQIGNSEGMVTKPALMQWMHDVKLESISDHDFDALWTALDPDCNDEVNAIDFLVFLSACGSQFEEVFEEQQNMPQQERLRLAARRLSNINRMGVQELETPLERSPGQPS